MSGAPSPSMSPTAGVAGEMIQSGSVQMVVLNREHIDDERLATLESLCEEHDVSLLRLHVGIEELVSHHGVSPAARLRAQLRKSRR